MTPVLGGLGELTIAGEPGSSGPGNTASLYPKLEPQNVSNASASTAGAKGKVKHKCAGCKRSIRHDHIAAAVKCECPLASDSSASSSIVRFIAAEPRSRGGLPYRRWKGGREAP